MSEAFKCLDWEPRRDRKDVQVTLEGSAKATSVSGNGCPGIFLRIPNGHSFVPDEEFCRIIRYFLVNYDLAGPNDPRLKLIEAVKGATQVRGYNGPGSKRIELP